MLLHKETHARKILRTLKSNRYVTNIDLNRIAYRYSARIHELRREGWNIQRQYERPGIYRYWLAEAKEIPEQ